MSRKGSNPPGPIQGDATIPVAIAVSAEPVPPQPPTFPVSTQSTAPPRGSLNFRPQPDPFIDTYSARQYLTGHGWPAGLQEALFRNLKKVPFRFFICDDSGSMASNDGKKMIGNKTVSCTRWDELTETLNFHVGLARACKAPTQFRMLNALKPVVIGVDEAVDAANIEALGRVFRESPGGYTPLCRHINEVTTEIRAMEQALRANGQKCIVIIATDGEASDGNIAAAMQALRVLPCSVVVRLCTDQDQVVDYWNNVDSELEIELDVIDDLLGEAGEIKSVNPWFVYGQPVQRFREFGVTLKEFDFIDESLLSHQYARSLISILLNINIDELAHPEVDYSAFERRVEEALRQTENVVNPTTGKTSSWINMQALKRSYGPRQCSIM